MIARLRSLTPDRERRWGTMTPQRMICHVSDHLRVAVGDTAAKFTGSFLSALLLRWIGAHTPVKPRGGLRQAAPEYLLSKPTDWESDMSACEKLIVRVGAREAHALHPSFGLLTPEEWGIVCWKHLDLHFRQFGI